MSISVERKIKMFSEKEVYRDKIIEMIKTIDNEQVLRYIYIVVRDIVKERIDKDG